MTNKWTCPKCECEILKEEYDNALNSFVVWYGNTRLGDIIPNNITDMHTAIELLDNGGCPVCDGWEDGFGNSCTLQGWNRLEDTE